MKPAKVKPYSLGWPLLVEWLNMYFGAIRA